MDEPRGHYTEWNKSKTDTVWHHLHVGFFKKMILHRSRVEWELPEVEGRRGQGDIGQRVRTFSYKRESFEVSMYSIAMILANDSVLYTWKRLTVDLQHSFPLSILKLTMYSDGCANCLDLGNHATMYTYIKSSCWIL